MLQYDPKSLIKTRSPMRGHYLIPMFNGMFKYPNSPLFAPNAKTSKQCLGERKSLLNSSKNGLQRSQAKNTTKLI